MSRKKREQAAREAEALRLQQEAEERERQAMMSQPQQVRASLRKMKTSGPVPIAPPADFIQLTPIVQPIPIVPYSSQNQALWQVDEDGYGYYDDYGDYEG